jgi:hypothetical protein
LGEVAERCIGPLSSLTQSDCGPLLQAELLQELAVNFLPQLRYLEFILPAEEHWGLGHSFIQHLRHPAPAPVRMPKLTLLRCVGGGTNMIDSIIGCLKTPCLRVLDLEESGVTVLRVPDCPGLETVRLDNCRELQVLDLAKINADLRHVSLAGCSSLRELVVAVDTSDRCGCTTACWDTKPHTHAD